MNNVLSSNRPLLVAVIMSTILIGCVGLIFFASLYMFNRRKFIAKLTSLEFLWSFTGIWVVNVILMIFSWLYGSDIFNNASRNGTIGFVAANFVIILTLSIGLVLFLEHMAIGIDNREIAFLGERVLLRNVLDFTEDEDKNKFILKYKENRNRTKTIKLKRSSVAGQFLFKHKDLIVGFNER